MVVNSHYEMSPILSGSVTVATDSTVIDLQRSENFCIIASITDTSTSPALSGASVTLNASLDGVVWVPVKTTNITGTANLMFDVDRPHYLYAKVSFAIATGSLTVAVNFVKDVR